MTTLITKAEYEQVKASFIATLKRLMLQHGLSTSDIQKQTAAAYMAGKEPTSVTMQDLYHYLQGHSVPKEVKLGVLARVLKVPETDLIPQKLQNARVQRRRDNMRKSSSGHVEVFSVPGGEKAIVRIEITCEPVMAHAIAAAASKVVSRLGSWSNKAPHDQGEMERATMTGFEPNAFDKSALVDSFEVDLDAALEQDLQKIQ